MANVKKYKNESPEHCDLSTWPLVDTSRLTDERKKIYLQREDAVNRYFSGERVKDIADSVGLTRAFIVRLVQKCLSDHPDGRIYGYRGLLPNTRVAKIKYTRTKDGKRAPSKKGGLSGSLGRLFERFPDIREKIHDLFFKNKANINVHEPIASLKSLHKHFIDLCRAHGITNEWPFNTKRMGKAALSKYLKKLLLANYSEGVEARFGTEAKRKSRLGGAEEPLMTVDTPFCRVEFDGHHIDICFVIKIPARGGGFIDVVVNRLWILVVREYVSGAILSYEIAYGAEYNQYDVMQCFKKAIIPWTRKELTFPGLKYHDQGGMPSEVIEELKWALFREVSYDSAKANISHECKRILKDVLDCHVNNGPLKFPEYRNLVESFFRLLEENGFHRLPSTLGSNPKDPRRNDPEKNAIKFQIRQEHIEDLVAVMISNFNNTPTARLDHRSPLEFLKYYASQDDVYIPILEEGKREKKYMFDVRFVKKVRGSIKQGKRPYIHILGADYTSTLLADSQHLIGKELAVYVDHDARFAKAFLSDGNELGVLTAKGYWGRTAHTLETRRKILAAKQKGLIHYLDNDDPIHVMHQHYEKEAANNKRAAKEWIKMEKTKQKHSNTANIPSTVGNATIDIEREQMLKRTNEPIVVKKKVILT